MTLFWLIGAALAAAVLALLLRPLVGRRSAPGVSRESANVTIYRDQMRELEAERTAGLLAPADFERARTELEARLLEDVSAPQEKGRAAGRRTALAVGVAAPLLAGALYLAVGNPGAIPARHAVRQIDAMVSGLAERLKRNPDDVQGWTMLGRSYAVLGRFAESADAYAQAAARAPRDPQVLVDFADALAMSQGQRLEGEPEKLIARALELDPKNLKALALAGTAAFEREDFRGAAAYWKRMLPLVPSDSEEARAIGENIAQAEARAAPAAQGAALLGTISMAPALGSRVSPDDVVFIYARAESGPPMPLAVARARVRDLPYRFRLDDSMAMAPALKLSAYPRVIVGARVSKSGAATPRAGDLQGTSAPVANDAKGVAVVIDHVVE